MKFKRPIRVLIFLVIVGGGAMFFFITPLLGNGFDQNPPFQCEKLETISEKERWFLEAHYISIGLEKERFSFLPIPTKSNSSFCVDIARFDFFLKNKKLVDISKETIVKTLGFLDAIESWTSFRNITYSPEYWPTGKSVQDRVEELTGIRFKSLLDLKAWYDENSPYLVWSEERSILVLMRNLKKENDPVYKVGVEEFSPKSFFSQFYFSRGPSYWNENDIPKYWVYGEWAKGMVYSRAARGFINFKVPASTIRNLEAKEKGLRERLNLLVNDLTLVPLDLEHYESERLRWKIISSQIKMYTNHEFKTPREFIDWYLVNENHLVYNPENEKLLLR